MSHRSPTWREIITKISNICSRVERFMTCREWVNIKIRGLRWRVIIPCLLKMKAIWILASSMKSQRALNHKQKQLIGYWMKGRIVVLITIRKIKIETATGLMIIRRLLMSNLWMEWLRCQMTTRSIKLCLGLHHKNQSHYKCKKHQVLQGKTIIKIYWAKVWWKLLKWTMMTNLKTF